MIRINELKLPLDEDEKELYRLAAKALKIGERHIRELTICKKSVDCRKKDDIKFIFSVDVALDIDEKRVASKAGNRVSLSEKSVYTLPPVKRKSTLRPVIVGFGPAGMFAALTLTEAGLSPIIIERGETVDERTASVKSFWQTRVLNPESNVQFGEGGAGTFSDGKLTTGIKDKRCRRVFEKFCEHGAPSEIMYSATPHIGTDRLAGVVKAIRKTVEGRGGEFMFNTKLCDLIIYNGHIQGITVCHKDGSKEDIETDTVILSIGHSARDTLEMLRLKGIDMMKKPFSVGVRIEHRQEMINKTQYGKFASHPKLNAANYKLACHPQGGRGAYTFCMCPGGFIVPAMTRSGESVVNGMSPSGRNSVYANSGIVTEIRPEDFAHLRAAHGELAGLRFQQQLEELAYAQVGDRQVAPGQRLADFVRGTASKTLPKCSYVPGVAPTEVHRWLPPFISGALRGGFAAFDRKMRGFLTNEALVVGVESRTSSPVRVPRDPDTLMHPRVQGLFPSGEGAGYAGGIISAAMDGERCAERVAEYVK